MSITSNMSCWLAVLMVVAGGSAAEASDSKLPAPLDAVIVDLGDLDAHFTIADSQLYESRQFKSLGQPPRVIAEQVLVWTLEAKAELTGKQAAQLFENPFPVVKFYATASGQDVSVGDRKDGYFLATDRRWIRGDGPALKDGDRITVYMPLGKTGTTELVNAKATKLVVEKKAE